MNDVVIEIDRGLVAGVYCDTSLRVVVVDWDLNQRLEEGVTVSSTIDTKSLTELPETTRVEYQRIDS